ncbi:MAG: iron ABC transporter permease, partial [Gammaproteobacteria bacterium]
IVRFEFPGRAWLEWLLVLPLAVPAYVLAFVVEGWFGVGGAWYRTCVSWFGRTLVCEPSAAMKAIVTLALVLYPYVYLLSRLAFMRQSPQLFAVSRSLGLRPVQVFWRVALPLARPAVMAGLALVLMETAADFGAVSVFNFDTLTTAVYKTWYGLFNLVVATQLASLLMAGMLLLIVTERLSRREMRYGGQLAHRLDLRRVVGWRGIAMGGLLWLLVMTAFVGPILQLAAWAVQGYDPRDMARLVKLLEHTVVLAFSAGVLLLSGSVLLLFVLRGLGRAVPSVLAELPNIGYAIPGTVLAVAVMLSLNTLDGWLARVTWLQGAVSQGQSWLVGGVAGLLVAYWVRFLSVTMRPVAASLIMIKPNLAEAAKTLGETESGIWRRIYLPLVLPGMMTGFLTAVVEVAKEMPATLLLRPFGWDTLAVKIYALTSEGEWYRAAWPGLTLVVLGLVPVYLLIRRSRIAQTRTVARSNGFGKSV